MPDHPSTDGPENPHAGQGMVVLDIGGDVGALIVSAPAALAGVELEICPAGARGATPDEGGSWWQGEWRHVHHRVAQAGHDHGHDHGHGPAWPHVAVLGRPGGSYAAVFPGLAAGRYDVWQRPGGPTLVSAEVFGGEVSTVSTVSTHDHAAATTGPT